MKTREITNPGPRTSTLEILFGGSCAFIEHDKAKKVRVLLPKKAEGWAASDGTVVPPHRAFIKFRMAYHDPGDTSPRKPDFTYLDEGDPVGICFLDNETLTIGEVADDDLFINSFPLKKSKVKPAADEFRSFAWVADVGQVCTEAVVRPEYLRAALPTDVAARIDLLTGILETDFIGSEVCEFDPKPDRRGTYKQRLAGFVSAATKVNGYHAFISSDSEPTLRLRAIDRKIRVEILNEVLEDIILPSRFWRPLVYKDYDFEMVYALTNVSTRKRHWHAPVHVGKGVEGGKPGECVTARFRPASFQTPGPPRKAR